jgi:hypothetical protein
MSRASSGLTSTSGISVPGSIACGSCSQRTSTSGVLGSSPAIYRRAARSASGGPTRASGSRSPGIAWHEVQP